MRFHVVATDYDGTLAQDGRVADETVGALERLAASGRQLVLVSGRELPDLRRVFPRLDLFDRVVVENGALLFRPKTNEEHPLAEPPPRALVDRLRAAGVSPLSVGRSIVATWTPHEDAVLDAIRDLGLEHHVVFNKGAVMVLPPNISKASGLMAALAELGVSPHNAVGIGDAENDHAFLRLCEASVAVANALETVKETADLVTGGDHGPGVIELAEALLRDDLASLDGALDRHRIRIGVRSDREPELVAPYGERILVAGPSASGKSRLVDTLSEALAAHGYQFCLIDPEGDYETAREAVVIGTSERPPALDEVVDLLADPRRNAIANLTALPLADRPALGQAILARVAETRQRSGHPHWLIVDEAHHLLPSDWQPSGDIGQLLETALLVTVHPERLSRPILASLTAAITFDDEPGAMLRTIAGAWRVDPPRIPAQRPSDDTRSRPALRWRRADGEIAWLNVDAPDTEHRRHRRKYMAGDVGEDRSFHFRGPDRRLDLRAQNLETFCQIADGVDDETWLHHLHRGDVSRWVRETIKDGDLATEIGRVEGDRRADPRASREAVIAAIHERYAAPA